MIIWYEELTLWQDVLMETFRQGRTIDMEKSILKFLRMVILLLSIWLIFSNDISWFFSYETWYETMLDEFQIVSSIFWKHWYNMDSYVEWSPYFLFFFFMIIFSNETWVMIRDDRGLMQKKSQKLCCFFIIWRSFDISHLLVKIDRLKTSTIDLTRSLNHSTLELRYGEVFPIWYFIMMIENLYIDVRLKI